MAWSSEAFGIVAVMVVRSLDLVLCHSGSSSSHSSSSSDDYDEWHRVVEFIKVDTLPGGSGVCRTNDKEPPLFPNPTPRLRVQI